MRDEKMNNIKSNWKKDPRFHGDVIILFDGVCNLCNRTVNFIIERDYKNVFKFAAFQSEAGRRYLKKIVQRTPVEGNFSFDLNTVILIDNDKYYYKSTAELRIAKELKGLWKIFYILIIVPPFLRNFIYNIIAKNRYKWFGKRDTCRVPTKDLKEKFL